MVAFCGDRPFWDWNRTWNTDDPDFTICFEDSVLAWTPCAFLWLFAGLDVYNALNSRGRDIPWNPLNISKLLVTSILGALQLILFAYQLHRESTYTVYPIEKLSPMVRFLTFDLAIFLIIFAKKKGVRSSGVQFLFWMLMVVMEAFAFRTAINNSINGGLEEDKFVLIIRQIYYPFVMAQFLLSCWADAAPTYQEQPKASGKVCPEESASFLSRLMFFWFDKLAWKGYKKPLTNDDLWDLNPEDKSASLVPLFDKYWKRTLAQAKAIPDGGKATYRNRSASVDFVDPKSKREKRGGEASVLGPIIRVFGPELLSGAVLKLAQDLLTFVSPQILKLLISYVADSNKEGGSSDDWKGYLYAILLLASSFIQTILLNQYFQIMFIQGMRIRTTLVSAIYKKALVISSAARKESTVGEIVNLMSVDAQRFMDLTTYINMIWSAPLQIILSLYFLWDVLGPSVLAGFGMMIILIPINAVMASKIKTLQIGQMKNKDERVKLMNEILNGIKVLKLYAWEYSFEAQVMGIRGKEIKVLKDAAYLNAGAAFIWTCAPFLVAVVSFATYVLSDPANILDAEKAFVALSLFNILRFPLSMLPNVISAVVQASVSLKRLNKYMNADEIKANSVTHDAQEADPVVIENGTFSWDPETTILRNINMHVKQGSLVAICGSVGSGKSSLLSALLGEMEKETGRVNTRGSIAYVPQQAWIQNATLRDNVLFGRPLEPTKYEQVIHSCALKPDLEVLTAGDKTEIGEKGINLSGGQKQRVSLARATYNNADVYLLDDPLSAVDAHVGKHLFEQVLGPKGILRHKTRLLVTHGVTYLPQMDQILVLKDGEITEAGTYSELLAKKGAFAEFLIQHIAAEGDEDLDLEENAIVQDLEQVVGVKIERQRSRLESTGSDKHSPLRQLSHDSVEQESVRRRLSKSLEASTGTGKKSDANGSLISSPDKLIDAEKSETGSVKASVYWHYFKAVGWPLTCVTLFFHVIFQALAVSGNLWLSEWSNSNEGRSANETQPTSERDMYLGVYAGLGVGQAVAAFIGDLTLFNGTLMAASAIHKLMLRNVMRCPMSFFDTTPSGRIVNRFAKEVDVLDNVLSRVFHAFSFCLLSVLATLVVITYSTPIFMSVIIPIGIVYFLVQRFYVATSRQLKRLESVSRSPIYSHFGETIAGCTTIRAYSVQERFMHESETKVDNNQTSYYPNIVSNRWVAVRLETLGNLIVFFAAMFAVIGRRSLSPGLVGLSVSYALQITSALNWLVRMTSEVEANIVAVERIKEYSELPEEAAWENEDTKPPANWPEEATVEFNGYSTRYREGLDLVLKKAGFRIQPGEKIGIVGRTGAGKSSLTLALFRIIESVEGKIEIGGRDISTMGLHDLRSRLTIIPQDPFLFSGTLRMNLDPFSAYTDEVLWHALELAHLKHFVKGLGAGLLHPISEGGDNLSVGQRQLVCLARALLRKTKILVLDEATAAVDLETDDLIQKTIRSEFKECTVLTIAHRLNTIMDSSRLLVFEKGQLQEFDTPNNLLQNRRSIFYSMAKDAGLVS